MLILSIVIVIGFCLALLLGAVATTVESREARRANAARVAAWEAYIAGSKREWDERAARWEAEIEAAKAGVLSRDRSSER